MRKLDLIKVDVDGLKPLKVLTEVEGERTLINLENAIGKRFSEEAILAILNGVQKLPAEPEKFRAKPKLHIDLENGLAWPIGWPVYLETAAVTEYFIPVGLSIGLLSKDGKVIAIQRSLKNKSCKGFLGTPAGYMILPYQDFSTRKLPANVDLKQEIKKNVEDQLLHELGLLPEEYLWEIAWLANVDYPETQQEFLVSAKSSLTAKEIVVRAAKNKGTDTGLAENRVIPMEYGRLGYLLMSGVRQEQHSI
jgi:transcriptional regulator of met regulon